MNMIPYGQSIFGLISAIAIGIIVILFWVMFYRMIDEEEPDNEHD